ncbi:hypothetical protein BDN72DRAFT_161147 [Pluteus cervinus]|uniref:Uncharacterized protein n=1 Tax=Pluteus cervinus TaxID=181527 RepID=A0ACD3ALE2_9AGAR|nr:hypothetical protein BDN72DRAFT_161147 [Pluteus cervinus]
MALSMQRIGSLPHGLHLLIGIRLASTVSDAPGSVYPFPKHPRPTPHQIFHLSPSASQVEIKARYYDLVRIHHPDSPHSRLIPAAERHSRFQSITAAYDVLRGKTSGAFGSSSSGDHYAEEVARRKRAYWAQRARTAEFTQYAQHGEWSASADDRWKDKIILIVGILTLALGIAPGLFLVPSKLEKMHQAAAASLKGAREDAKEIGDERRARMKDRVRDIRAQAAEEERMRLEEPEDKT